MLFSNVLDIRSPEIKLTTKKKKKKKKKRNNPAFIVSVFHFRNARLLS